MDVCIKVPSHSGSKVFCKKTITDTDYVPLSIQHGVIECIRPDEFRDVCPACRTVLAKHIQP